MSAYSARDGEYTGSSTGVLRRQRKCPGYDTKKSDGEDSVIPELRGMQRTPSQPSLPGPLWPGQEAPDTVLSVGKTGMFDI